MSLHRAESGSHDHHPLSALHPTSTISIIPGPAGSSRPSDGYFDPIDSSHRDADTRTYQSLRYAHKAIGTPQADLLGVAASQRLRKPRQSFTKASPALSQNPVMEPPVEPGRYATLQPIASRNNSSGSRSWSLYFGSLSKEEVAVMETRFDLMSEDELEDYLGRSAMASSLPPRDDPPRDGSSITPKGLRHTLSLRSSRPDDEDSSPLFPPSPPPHTAKRGSLGCQSLRILSRGVRELQEAVERLEEENERLRSLGNPVIGRKSADQVSIHDNLTEALSTSLTDNPPSILPDHTSLRSLSPTPSTSRSFRRRSPASSTSSPLPNPLPATTLSPTTPKLQSNRAAWTSGLWVWNSGKKVRSRGESAGSFAPHSQTAVSVPAVPDSAVIDDEDEDGRKKGDGGSPSSFRAIFLATRIITPDPSSILSSAAIPANALIAYLAHSLVSNARDEGIVAHDPPSLRRSHEQPRSRTVSIVSTEHQDTAKGYGDQALAVGRSLLSSVSNATIGGSKPDGPVAPSLLHRISSSRPFPTTAVSPPTAVSGSPATSPTEETPLPSVELTSIVPDESRPPTVLLSRQNLGSFFQSSRVGKAKLATASRFDSTEPPLTDRYGFIYDIQHARMLKDASAAGTPAPASLNGMVPLTGEEGWIERQRRATHDSKAPRRSSDSPEYPSSHRSSIDSANSVTSSRSSRTPDNITTSHRHRSSTLSLNPSPARPVTAKEHLTVSARGSSSLHASVTPSLPKPEPSSAVSRLTVTSLLAQLTEIHDRQQKERMAQWDVFLRKRDRARKGLGVDLVGISDMGSEDCKVFARLVRGGVPLAYRSDVWAECSGAKDLMVPGEYKEILAVHKEDTSSVMAEIEKDVSRTFPGNVFFGGDGPGVAKLRRVLVAYSWHNPAVGYCQGMNMLAATLLLTHTDEEQAYWTLLCMIERLLPTSFFYPDLLASRADQLVLADLVAQLVPKVHSHLEALGVDLASVTFGWFLSLFTDCLPVETLFRVWDVFFVEGHDALFRVAISVLKLNEPDILACESVSDLFTFVSGMTSRLWGADKLIAMQHSYKPIARHAEVLRLFEGHLVALQKEIDEAEG